MTVALPPISDTQASSLRDLNALYPENARSFDLSTPAQPDDPNSFAESFGAALWRENTISSAAKWVYENWNPQDGENGYNPYRSLREQFPKETLDQLRQSISDGAFDDVRSDGQLKERVQDQLDRQKATNGWGYFAGSLVASALDPTSYIPLAGEAAIAARFGRVGVGAAHALLSTASSEAILKATQGNDRSLTDSLMNIGTAGLIGGGWGIFSSALHPKSALHPTNPDNVLKPENLYRDGEVSRDMLGHQDEITAAEVKSLNDSYVAAGAAPAIADIPSLARVEPKTALGRRIAAVTGKVGDVLNSATIKGQVLRATSGRVRWAGVRLFDPAGILFEHNLKGIGNAPSATILKEHYMSEFEQLSAGMEARSRALSAETKRRIDYKDVLRLTQRQLYSMDDDDTIARLSEKYGEDFQKVHALAGELANRIHEFNGVWEDRLTKAGLMQDPKEVARLSQELKFHRDRLEQIKVEGGAEGDLNAVRRERDDVIQKLSAEKAKPTPLGRDYGHAQVWNRDHVFASPSEFKAWLHEVLALTPDEGWLLENHHMTKEEFDKLTPEEAQPIREDWSGDAYGWRVDQLQHRVEGLQQSLKEQKLDLAEALRWFGALDKRETNLTLSEARKKRDAIWGRINANRAGRAAESRKPFTPSDRFEVVKEADGHQILRPKGLPEKWEHEGTRGDTGIGFNETADSIQVTFSGLPHSERGKGTGIAMYEELAKYAESKGKTLSSDDNVTAEATNMYEALRKRGYNVVFDKQSIPGKEAGYTSSKWVSENGPVYRVLPRDMPMTKLGRDAADKAAKLDALLRKVEATHEDIKASKDELKKGIAEAKAHRAETEKNFNAAGRGLKKARNATPLNEVIEQVYANLADRGSTPQAILDRLLETSDREVGRVKKRGLNLTREQRAHAIQRGWLRDDLSNILYMQTDQLASELALREALDIGKGKTFSSWGDLLDWIERDYQDRIEAAKTQAEKDALTAELKKQTANLVMARDRLKGGLHIDDGTANGWLGWTSRKMKQANMIRYGSGFTLSSLTDTASVALRHGSISRLLARHAARAIKIMQQSADEDITRFRAMIASVEIGMGAHAAARRFGTEDALNGHLYGYGIGHGNLRKVTGAIDRGGEFLSDIGIKMGGLPHWNTFWKTVVGLDMLDRLHDLSQRYHLDAEDPRALSAAQKADLATLGIGAAEAQRLGEYMSKYAERDADGHLDPHFEKWDGPSGQSAARDAELAIMRDMNRAINTPDVGDTPRLMSTHLGSLLLSFQTFAFTFMNQYAYPLVQRLALFHEKQAYMSLGILLGAATLVMVGKDIINGRDPADRFKPENAVRTSYDIVDRSGLLGWTSPLADAGLKMTPLGGGTRYSRNGALASLLGINFGGLVNDVSSAGAAVTSGDPHAARKVLALAPFSAQARLLQRIFDHNP